MSALGARFFAQVQSAAFYRELHARAVRLLPPGAGRAWFDAGTGPGLVARLAAAHGYRATGFDIDPAMIEQARTLSHAADFEAAGLDALAASGRCADVVSAASLLAVLEDREEALRRLMACVKGGGALLVVEAADAMTPRAAWAWLRQRGAANGGWLLLVWALARARGRRGAVKPADLRLPGLVIEHADVFEGMVNAWVLRRDGARVT